MDQVSTAIGRDPDRTHRKGSFVARSKTKKYDSNIYRYELINSKESSSVNASIISLLENPYIQWESISAGYRYLDFLIEKGSLVGAFYLEGDTVEKLRELDIQIQVDITRY